MARAYFNWLPNGGAGDSGTVPLQIRRVEVRTTSPEETTKPEEKRSNQSVERAMVSSKTVLFSPKACVRQDAEEFTGQTVLRQTAGLAARVDTRTRLLVHHAGSVLPMAWRARNVAPPLPMWRPSGSEPRARRHFAEGSRVRSGDGSPGDRSRLGPSSPL